MKSKKIVAALIIAAGVSALSMMVLAAQDKSTVKAPNGVAFCEFKGYENGIKVSLANLAMIKALGTTLLQQDIFHQCHTIVKAKDFILTGYPLR
jgi:hypothetical protein